MDPFILPELRVEDSLLQILQLEGESRAQLLEIRLELFSIFLVDVTMMSNENKVTLIVEGHDLSPFELRILAKEQKKMRGQEKNRPNCSHEGRRTQGIDQFVDQDEWRNYSKSVLVCGKWACRVLGSWRQAGNS